MMLAACTKGGDGITYAEHVNVSLAVSMPDGGLITPVIKVEKLNSLLSLACTQNNHRKLSCLSGA